MSGGFAVGQRLRCALALGCAAQQGCGPTQGDAEVAIPDDLVEQYAAARCGAMVRCGCEPAGFVDVAMCTAAMHQQYDARVAALGTTAASFVAPCLDAVIEYWASPDACADPRVAPRVPYCALVDGEQSIAEPCGSISTYSFSASSCADGLYCRDGEVCDEAPSGVTLASGEPCIDADYPCADGTYCDATSGRCAMRRGAGLSCDAAAACDADTYCAGLDAPAAVGTCTARAAAGEACGGATAWDARACAPEPSDPTLAHYCVDAICTGPVPAACGPWL